MQKLTHLLSWFVVLVVLCVTAVRIVPRADVSIGNGQVVRAEVFDRITSQQAFFAANPPQRP